MDMPPEIAAWFAKRGWGLRRHQRDMLAAGNIIVHKIDKVGSY